MKRCLEAVGLKKKFHKKEVVCDVSISVEKGEVVGLLGPNGAGKTTTFSLILGLIHQDEGQVLLGGEDITGTPKMFIGAAANPFGEPYAFRVHRLAKKIAAGADFIQTQCIYNMDRFREWVKQANDMGLSEKVYILAGVTPMKSLGMARYMKNNVPGMDVPDWVIKRLKGVDKKEQAKEGIAICCEQIQEFKEMKGVAGVHLMAIEWEHRVPEIVEQAGLLPRPVVEQL